VALELQGVVRVSCSELSVRSVLKLGRSQFLETWVNTCSRRT
jgi:hypothetical protein